MGCYTYIDLISNGYRPTGVEIFLLIVGVSAAAVWLMTIRWAPSRFFDRIMFKISLPLTAISTFIICGIRMSASYGEYNELMRLYHAGISQSIEGVIADYTPFSTNSSTRKESFRIGAVTFSYDPNLPHAGFHGTLVSSNQLRDGELARAVYVEGQIIRLEICAELPSHQ